MQRSSARKILQALTANFIYLAMLFKERIVKKEETQKLNAYIYYKKHILILN